MRDIKFRAWDKQFKEMIDLPFPPRSAWFEKDGEGGPDDFEIMQYTGLLDKNRAKIFEGDILEYDDIQQHYGKEIRKRIKGVVEYHPCYFSCGKVRLGGFSPEHFQMEIIGNIYENPELVK